jgi:hypothetical protein
MLEHATGTVSFFQAMAPILIANVLTLAFVYSFAKIHQKELAGGSPDLSVADRARFLFHALRALHLGHLSLQTINPLCSR